jgi:membrane-associated phospholipid phosphatase
MHGKAAPATAWRTVCLAFAIFVAIGVTAHAQTPAVRANPLADGATLGAAVLGSFALSGLSVHKSHWRGELLPIDESVRGAFSREDAEASDATLAVAIAFPIAAEAARPHADSLSMAPPYAEALAVGVLLNTASKYLVSRPRPYVYGDDPEAEIRVRRAGDDAYLSFYSGHATAAFAAAVAGSTLFSYSEPNRAARALVWGPEMALASATAVLRVRAGQHYPSDVLFGAVVGSAVGLLVARAHFSDRDFYSPSTAEWAAIGGGLLVGSTVSLLPRRAAAADVTGSSVVVAPWPLRGGGGVLAGGLLF